MSRNGKIARLPASVREQINRRLQNGENGQDILTWLNSLDEVKSALAGEFEESMINDVNLSAWRNGGYRDWEAQQTALDEARLLMAEGGELAEAGQKALGDHIAVWLLGQYLCATRKLRENRDDPAGWKLLRELCHDVVALRRGDHGAEWLRLEHERLEFERLKDERNRAAQKPKPEADPKAPARVMTTAEKQRKYRQIFGMEPL